MSLKFKEGDVVNIVSQEEKAVSCAYTVEMVGEEIVYLKNEKGELAEAYQKELQYAQRLFAVYYQHDYGSTQWIMKSSVFPTQEQIIECLNIDFEEDRGEFIAIEEIDTIDILELS